MDEVGTLRICINVHWQGMPKRVTVHSKFCTRDQAMSRTREFMKMNPCIPNCSPEVTWTFTETLEL